MSFAMTNREAVAAICNAQHFFTVQRVASPEGEKKYYQCVRCAAVRWFGSPDIHLPED